MFYYFCASEICPDKMSGLWWEGPCKSIAIMTTFEGKQFGMFFIFFVFVAQTEFNTLVQNRQFKYFVLFFKLSLEVVLGSFVSNLLKLIFALDHNLNIPIQSFFFFFYNLLIVHTRSRISPTTRSAHSKLCHITYNNTAIS
jgi:hypothetical protein